MISPADPLLARLVRWCEQPSGSSDLAGLAVMARMLLDEFTPLGGTWELVPVAGDRAIVRGRARPDAPLRVLLTGHYDTVYDAAHPFKRCDIPAAHPERLRGPGVADMKGGLVVLHHALAALEASPRRARVGWEVLLTPDEEIGSPGSAPILAEAASRHQLGLVFETSPLPGHLVRARKGTGLFTFTVHGRSAHAGLAPHDGRNAILALAALVQEIAALHGSAPGLMLNVGAISGGGPLNLVPDRASLGLNARIDRNADAAPFLARLSALADSVPARFGEGYRAEFSGSFGRPALEITPAAETWFVRWRALAAERGLALDWVDVPGGSDGNNLVAAGLPCLDGLGPVGGALHSPDEFILAASLPERAELASAFLLRLAAHPGF